MKKKVSDKIMVDHKKITEKVSTYKNQEKNKIKDKMKSIKKGLGV